MNWIKYQLLVAELRTYTYVMIPIQEDKKCAGSRRHTNKSPVRKGIIVKLPRAIVLPNGVLLLFITSIENAKI